jgi:hypothetical protein
LEGRAEAEGQMVKLVQKLDALISATGAEGGGIPVRILSGATTKVEVKSKDVQVTSQQSTQTPTSEDVANNMDLPRVYTGKRFPNNWFN